MLNLTKTAGLDIMKLIYHLHLLLPQWSTLFRCPRNEIPPSEIFYARQYRAAQSVNSIQFTSLFHFAQSNRKSTVFQIIHIINKLYIQSGCFQLIIHDIGFIDMHCPVEIGKELAISHAPPLWVCSLQAQDFIFLNFSSLTWYAHRHQPNKNLDCQMHKITYVPLI